MDQDSSFGEVVISCFKKQNEQLHLKTLGQQPQYSNVKYIFTTDQADQAFKQFIYQTRDANKMREIKFNTISAFQQNVKVTKLQEQYQIDPKTVFAIKTPLVHKQNVYQLMRKSEQQNSSTPRWINLKSELIQNIITALIIKVMSRSNYQLYTSQTLSITVDQKSLDVTIDVDEASVVGMDLLLYGQSIPLKEYQQIYDLVNFANSAEISYQFKIRAIAKILLQLIIGIKKNLFQAFMQQAEFQLKTESMVTTKKFEEDSRKLSYFFRSLLQTEHLNQMIEDLEKQHKVQYKAFLYKVLVEEVPLTWQKVIELLVAQKTVNQSQYAVKPNLISFQQMMSQLLMVREITHGASYINNLKELGLYNQPKPLFIAMLSQISDFADKAICYSDMNQFLYGSNSLDFEVRDEFFPLLAGILGEITHFRTSLQAKRYINDWQIQNYKQPEGEQQGQQNDEPSVQIQNNYQPQSSKQISDSLKLIATNFGRLQTRIKKAIFVSQNYYSKGFNRYIRKFK